MTNTETILVVDDEPGLTDLYEAWLQVDYAVRSATSGEDALAAIDGAVDAVLLDRQMPGLSGDDVLAEIRDRGYDCPVSLVTAAKPTADVLDRRFDAYLLKPVDRGMVAECVDALLAVRGFDAPGRRCVRAASTGAVLTDNFAVESAAERALLDRCARTFDRAAERTDLTVTDVFGSDAFPRPPRSTDHRADARQRG